ncbi:MAG: hypothetical protein ABIJ43_00150, partial [Candidatus Beckwithbacteria bacterium]
MTERFEKIINFSNVLDIPLRHEKFLTFNYSDASRLTGEIFAHFGLMGSLSATLEILRGKVPDALGSSIFLGRSGNPGRMVVGDRGLIMANGDLEELNSSLETRYLSLMSMIHHLGIHTLDQFQEKNLPTWLVEGVALFFETSLFPLFIENPPKGIKSGVIDVLRG